MFKVGVIGFGVVGSGVVEIIDKNKVNIQRRAEEEVEVKKILDIREFPDSPYKELFTTKFDDLINDSEIKLIVESIGGVKIAYDFTKEALKAKKHVVTSNKELVALHGPELLRLAKEMGVSYLFEASVGGGIPIIRPMYKCLGANEILSIRGILNGTTNYILSKMKNEGYDFKEALKQAQANGYAEADPTNDIEGYDACRKLAILSSIAYNGFVDYNKIYTEGIAKIDKIDMDYAESIDHVIKLVALSKKVDGKITARVTPAMVSKSDQLSTVEDVFNAIVVEGDAIGDAMFSGRGAGKLPTASAVVADIIDIVKHTETISRTFWEENNIEVLDIDNTESNFFIRLNSSNNSELVKLIEENFENSKLVFCLKHRMRDEIAFTTSIMNEKLVKDKIEIIMKKIKIDEIKTIRIIGNVGGNK